VVDEPFLRYGFSIVGVQKAGTSTLARTVNSHPLVCRAPQKELHFFNREDVDWAHPPYDEYRCPRRRPAEVLAGDSTPAYLWWPHALERMHDYNPDMRLIAIFRDPIERVFSHWTMLRRDNPRAPDWPRLLHEFRPPSLPTEIPADVPPLRFKRRSAIARGYYGEQLRRGFEIFPRDQWLLLEFRSMLADYAGTLDRVTDFLGLHRFRRTRELPWAHAGPEELVGTAPTADDVAGLARLYERDLDEFATLSGLDVSHWPTRRVLDGALDPGELAGRLAAKVTPPSDVA
jgi:hypothetical protein